MRRHFVQERGKKCRHSSATATVFNEVIGQKSEQIQAIYFVTTPNYRKRSIETEGRGYYLNHQRVFYQNPTPKEAV